MLIDGVEVVMASIGIMGGTFNPIHIGHVQIAKAAYTQYHLDEIWFMPNHIPAYKSEDHIVSGIQRLEMVRCAIQEIPYCKASDFELNREGNTYTIDTLISLKMLYPEHTFYFIMGADSLFSFDKWMKYEKIPQYTNLLVAPRGEQIMQLILDKVKEYNHFFGKEVFFLIECEEIQCSSSEIRVKLQSLAKADDFNEERICNDLHLSKAVLQYIIQNNLYVH